MDTHAPLTPADVTRIRDIIRALRQLAHTSATPVWQKEIGAKAELIEQALEQRKVSRRIWAAIEDQRDGYALLACETLLKGGASEEVGRLAENALALERLWWACTRGDRAVPATAEGPEFAGGCR